MREETINTTALREQIEGLRHMTVGQLKDKYFEFFGEESRSNHKQFLFRRIAWRMQANRAVTEHIKTSERTKISIDHPWRNTMNARDR